MCSSSYQQQRTHGTDGHDSVEMVERAMAPAPPVRARIRKWRTKERRTLVRYDTTATRAETHSLSIRPAKLGQ